MSTKRKISLLTFASGPLLLLLTNTQCDRTCGEPEREYEIESWVVVEDVREWVSEDGELLEEDCSLYCRNVNEALACKFDRLGSLQDQGFGGHFDYLYDDFEAGGWAGDLGGAGNGGGPGVVWVTCLAYDPGIDCY